MLINPKTKTPLQAVIFDKDGTLLDLDATWARSMATTIREVSRDEEDERVLFKGLGIDPTTETFNNDSVVRHAKWRARPLCTFDHCTLEVTKEDYGKSIVLFVVARQLAKPAGYPSR